MSASYLAYDIAKEFENNGLEVWFRNNEDYVANGKWYKQDYVSIEICQKKFEDDKWSYEIRLYREAKGHLPLFKERMNETKNAEYYYDMICNEIKKLVE